MEHKKWVEPETTDEYWWGVWDFVYTHFPETKDRSWILESPFFEILVARYPDMIFDDLKDWFEAGLVERKFLDFVASKVEGEVPKY